MTRQYFFPIIISVILVLFCNGCSDDPTTPDPDPEILFTASFDENFMNEGVDNRFVFASAPDGQVLDVATWSGAATVVLKNSSIHPDTISVTMVQYKNRALSLKTQLVVATGSSQTYTGSTEFIWPEMGNVEFLNAPRSESHINSSNGGSASGQGDMPSSAQLYLKDGMSDIFARVNPLNSPPIGGWLPDLIPGESDTLDFADPEVVKELLQTKVIFPSGYSSFICMMTKVIFENSTIYNTVLEERFSASQVPDALTLYYPNIEPEQLRTTFLLINYGAPGTFYYQDGLGPVPSVLETMEDHFTLANASIDSFAFTMTTHWDKFLTEWVHSGGISSRWIVIGEAPVQSFTLPQIPQEIAEMFPDLARDNYGLSQYSVSNGTIEEGMRRLQGKFVLEKGTLRKLADRSFLLNSQNMVY